MNKYTTLLSHIVALVVVIIWGSTFVFTKLLLLAGLTAAEIFVLRFIIAYLMLLGFALTKKSFRLLSASLKDEVLMLALGIVGGSLYFLTENSAMNYTTTTNTSLIVCMCPLFATALISLFYKSQRLHGIQIMGTLMAAVGVVVVVLNGRFVLHLSPLGDTLAFVACLCWAVYSLLMIPATRHYSTLFITRKVFFYGLLSMVPISSSGPPIPRCSYSFDPTFSAIYSFWAAWPPCFVFLPGTGSSASWEPSLPQTMCTLTLLSLPSSPGSFYLSASPSSSSSVASSSWSACI